MPGAIWSRNQNRCWANESGRAPSRATGTIGDHVAVHTRDGATALGTIIAIDDRRNVVDQCLAQGPSVDLALRSIAILADLQGPKIRIEKFARGRVELQPGQPFVLDCRADAPPGDDSRVGVSYLGLPNDVKTGDTLLLDDGLISLTVLEVVDAEVRCQVLFGGVLSDRKGLNRLGGGLSIAALSDKDRADIRLAAEIGADFLAVSFAKSADDMNEARRLLRAAAGGA